MAGRLLVCTVAAGLAALAAASPAGAAGEPTMALSQVRAGMHCTARSVLRGTAIATFSGYVIDVVDGQAGAEDARILMRFDDPQLRPAGIGEGFSGSPVSCPDAHGVQRVIGAISEGVGEYGNDKVLATPIGQILAQSPTPPSGASRPGARALSELTLTGVPMSLAPRLERAARRAGRRLVVAPGGPAAGRFAPQMLVPGASVAAGYADGDYAVSAVGTVTYRAGRTVWAFGHPLDAVGRRSLFLQDAYVYDVIDEPDENVGASYKLAAPGHDLGTLTADGLNAVAGRVGPRPRSIPFTLHARDADTGRVSNTASDVADETALGNPAGDSALDLVAVAAVTGTGGTIMGGAPVQQSGSMCLTLGLREWPRPVTFCNRYVGTGVTGEGPPTPVAAAAAEDAGDAVMATETPASAALHVTRLAVRLTESRGLDQAFIRSARAPARVHPGQRIRVALRVKRYRGAFLTRHFTLRVPAGVRPGRRTLTLRGTPAGADGGPPIGDVFDQAFAPPAAGAPTSVRRVVRSIKAIRRYDGVRATFSGVRRPDGRAATHAYRDPTQLITGRARVPLRVVKG